MATKSNMPKIISGIIATISLILFGFFVFPAFWFWVSLEVIAAIFVAVGCSGEWWLHHHPAGRKKNEKDEHHKLESRFIAMVSLGVIMEVFVLGHSINEGIAMEDKISSANERVANTESNNLVLQSKIKTRIITDDDSKDFIECLSGQPRGAVMISFDRGATANVRFYAGEISKLLISAGYSVSGPDICDVKPILPADTSIEVWTKSQNERPAFFFPLANCLTKVADKVVPNVNSDILWINTNELWLYIANYR